MADVTAVKFSIPCLVQSEDDSLDPVAGTSDTVVFNALSMKFFFW